MVDAWDRWLVAIRLPTGHGRPMRPHGYAKLHAIARRQCGDAAAAEDIVQEALLAAVIAGRADLSDAGTARWLSGVVRNQARMAARGATRRRHREAGWATLAAGEDALSEPGPPAEPIIAGLPAALRSVALLALTGHNRREIAYLLRLENAALRQRISQLKARLVAGGIALPDGMPGLNLDLAYGRIRDALLPLLLRQGGDLATHDPDGHLFVLRRSRKP